MYLPNIYIRGKNIFLEGLRDIEGAQKEILL